MSAYADRRVAVLDAPSNLGLRPPAEGSTPGVYKLAGALRDQNLLERLGATDAGVVTPPRYVSAWKPGDGVRNGAAIGRYSVTLAERIERIVGDGAVPLVLGGDCSILLGAMLALRRQGRFGVAYLDAHSDFRHPGNAPAVGAAAGEDLALVTGRGDELANLEGLGPLVKDEDVVVLGVRGQDEGLPEMSSAGMSVVTTATVCERGPERVAAEVIDGFAAGGVDGFWIHCDVDVLDERVMPAVDTPEPGGLEFEELERLLAALLRSELAAGIQITIFDPDLDEDGALADRLAGCLVDAFAASRT